MRQTEAVILGGVRTAFLETAGAYRQMMAHELGGHAIAGALSRVGLEAAHVDLVAMGIVVHEIETTNVAREAMLAAGIPSRVPAYTTAMAGLSPNMAVSNITDGIRLGRVRFAVAGGMETFSDVPIRLSPRIRRLAMTLRQSRSLRQRLRALAALRFRDLALDIPRGADFTTKQTMGESTEAMVRRYPVSREDADRFALHSHHRALDAAAWHAQDILPLVGHDGLLVTKDNTPRADITAEKLARLKPVFDNAGVVTAGNASRFTDGAAVVVLAERKASETAGYEPMAVVRDAVFTGVDDLANEMLLGPAMAIPPLLQRNGIGVDDVAVFELHEAFAAQILVNQHCLGSTAFARQRLGVDQAVGRIPSDRLNIYGGSLALGNPFAATGARLILNASRRLRECGEKFAVVSSCAGGGLGAALLLENPRFC